MEGNQLILDIRGPEMLATLPKKPLLVKPNREEFEATLGRKLKDEADMVAQMKSLNAQGAQWALVSNRDQPTLLTSTSETYRFHPCQVEKIENPIGCGDCLAAGIAWGLRKGQAMPDAVRLGMGAAADNLGDLLPARIDSRRSQDWAERVQFEKI